MSDFANLVKRINEIGASQAPSEKDVITESNTPYNKTAEESVTGTSETLSLLKVIDEINGEKIKESEDIADDLRTRFSDFMKSEVGQGNDIETITSSVKEGTSSAMAIDDSFNKMFNMMNRLMKITREGGVLVQMIQREGGDEAYIADAHQKLIEAMEALENANMFAQRQDLADED